MPESIYEIPPDVPVEDIRGGLANWFLVVTEDGVSWGSGIGYDDGSTLLQMMGVSSIDDVPAFIENATPEQLATLYAYKVAVENTENWNDLSDDEKNAILEDAGLGSPFGGGTEYAEGDQMAWEDMSREQQNAHALRRYLRTGETNPHYEGMTQEEIDAAYEYLKNDGEPAIYGDQDGVDYTGGGEGEGEGGLDLSELIEEFGEEIVGKAEELYNKIKGTVTDAIDDPVQAIKDLIPILFPMLKECRAVSTEDWWKDCVNLRILAELPWFDLPFPGILDVDFTIRDLENAIKDLGKTLEDFFEDPVGTIKDVLGDIWESIKDVWEGGEDRTLGGLIDILVNAGYGVLVGGILAEIRDQLVWDPIKEAFTFGGVVVNPCEDPAFKDNPGVAEKCEQYVNAYCKDNKTRKEDGCPEDIEPTVRPGDECVIDGRKGEYNLDLECEASGMGCADGYQANTDGGCSEVVGDRCTGTQLYNTTTGECEETPDFVEGEPCNENEESGVYDAEGKCIVQGTDPQQGDRCDSNGDGTLDGTLQPSGLGLGGESSTLECRPDPIDDPDPDTIVCPDSSDNPGKEVSNKDECYSTESPCRDLVYASENQEECWQQCKDGTYKQNAADCPDVTDGTDGTDDTEETDDTVKTIICPENSNFPGQEVSDVESCYAIENPCRSQSYAADHQEECWQECKDGSYKANVADCPDGPVDPVEEACFDAYYTNNMGEIQGPVRGTVVDGVCKPTAGQECYNPAGGRATIAGTIDENGVCITRDETPLECEGEITAQNYKECGYVECPANSTYTYAKTLAECGTTTTPEECAKPDGTLTGATVESGCEECPQGQSFNANGICVDTVTECDNGATVESGCNDCPEGQSFNAEGKCVKTATECDNGAVDYPLCVECADGSAPDPVTGCTTESPCRDASYAAANPLECGWVECPDGGFAPSKEECVGSECPEGQQPCAALGGECTTVEECPGEGEEGDDGGGGGGGGGATGMFEPIAMGIGGDPQLLQRAEFPITDYLAGLFEGLA